MIKITIPNNNLNERKYIIDILLGEFLELEYSLIVKNKFFVDSGWEIELENGNKLLFNDFFFNKFPKAKEYLKLENIPLKIEFIKNQFTTEKDIPVIYGNSTFNIENSRLITCGIDIFASSFFMISRWEEYVNKNRDSHNRFSAFESLAYKQSFLKRPIVNEYVEMLWNMLEYLGISQNRKIHKYQIYLTHDVDSPLKFKNHIYILSELVGDIIKRKDLKLAINNLTAKLKVLTGIKRDPFDTFDYLMDLSEKSGVKSYFFFMGRGKTDFDNMYRIDDNFIKKLEKKIKNRGHYFGIHSTYNAYNDQDQLAKEKQELERNLDINIFFGRGHYLRFEVPTTWQIWENIGMVWDSTLGFADAVGFRCGVCYDFSVFNILTRNKLKLKEKPLIVMEGSFVTYQQNITSNEMEREILNLIHKVKKYNGNFVLLWHNSSFNTLLWKKYQNIYERILNQ